MTFSSTSTIQNPIQTLGGIKSSTNSKKGRPELLCGGSRKEACHYGGRDDQVSAEFWICCNRKLVGFQSLWFLLKEPSIYSLDSITGRCWPRPGTPHPAAHLNTLFAFASTLSPLFFGFQHCRNECQTFLQAIKMLSRKNIVFSGNCQPQFPRWLRRLAGRCWKIDNTDVFQGG